ncbi:hypothetical protein DLREEDagrD3_22330 [Denitratisoma sp. agr-D3]
MRQKTFLLFPLAVLFNSFSMTALMLAFGLVGRSEVAADIGLVQAASLALFFAFSANGRNVVLAETGAGAREAASSLILTRLALMVPLAVATYFLSVSVGGAIASLSVVLILRRASEWIGEIALARHEVLGNVRAASHTVLAESVSLLGCLVGTVLFDIDLSICTLPWALVPLVAVRGGGLALGSQHLGFRALLPHFGSSGIIGASVFVFRLSVTLLAGKATAGSLFTAFAIGSLIPTVFGQALAPTLIRRYGNGRLPRAFAIAPLGMLLAGAALAGSYVLFPAFVSDTGLAPIFWLAAGLSIIGGGLMTLAILLRTRILLDRGGNVFGPDLLANVLIATCVPFVYHVCGVKCLGALYMLSALLNLAFLVGAKRQHLERRKGQYCFVLIICLLLVAPVFFQLEGGIFSDPAFVFDAQGSILKLPLPVSILALFVGIAVLGNYWQASRTLTTLFFSALLFVMTSLITAQGVGAQESAKLLLLAQYLMPMFALVLGEMIGVTFYGGRLFLWAACTTLLLVLPAQLIASILQGYTLLSPKVFLFSIYQHLQYFPMVVSALVIAVLIPFYSRGGVERLAAGALLVVSTVFLLWAQSLVSIVGLVIAICGIFAAHLSQKYFSRRAMLVSAGFLVTLVGLVMVGLTWVIDAKIEPASDQQTWHSKFSAKSNAAGTGLPSGLEERKAHWRFFYDGVVESPRVFLIGHALPPPREAHPSAHNYWLDTAYNFGILALLPMGLLLVWSVRHIYRARVNLLVQPETLGLVLALSYLLFIENMLKVGMRQPYPGILTFFLWGLLVARLRADYSVCKTTAEASKG